MNCITDYTISVMKTIVGTLGIQQKIGTPTWMFRYGFRKHLFDLGVDYGPACYTALVKAEKIERRTRFGSKTYEYKIVPTGTMKEAMEQTQRQREKDNAEYTINHYDESIARVRAHYEEMIKQAGEQLARDLEWEAEKLEKAKTTLAQMF